MTAAEDPVLVVPRDVVAVNESNVWSIVGADDISRLKYRVVLNSYVLCLVDDRQEKTIAPKSWAIDVLPQVVGDPHTTKTCFVGRRRLICAQQEYSRTHIAHDVIRKLHIFNDGPRSGIVRARR